MNTKISSQLTKEWNDCSEWLLKCLPEELFPLKEILINSTTKGKEILKCLQDGVILCLLLPRLSNNEIELSKLSNFVLLTFGINFVQKSNIDIFLEKCQTYFGLQKSSLFTTDDLIYFEDSNNIPVILQTLSLLSLTPQSLKNVGSGFHISSLNNEDTDEYYVQMFNCDQVDASRSRRTYSLYREDPVYSVTPITYRKKREEQVYENLIAVTKQTTVRDNFDYILTEMVESEEKYCTILSTLVNTKEKLKTESRFWSENELNDIFMFIPDLHAIHSELLKRLKQHVRLKDQASVIDLFLEFKPKLIVYALYCSRLNNLLKQLINIYSCENNKLIDLERALKLFSISSFKLTDFVAVPMYRITKYHLFFQSMALSNKKTTGLSTDSLSGMLQKVQNELVNLNSYINEYTRDFDMIEVINTIQNSIKNLPMLDDYKLTDYGRLLCDDEMHVVLKEVGNNYQKSSKLCYCFLLNQILIICSEMQTSTSKTNSNPTSVFKKYYIIKSLKNVEIEDIEPTVKNKGKWCYGLIIKDSDPKNENDSELNSVTLLTRSLETAEKWKQNMIAAMETLYPTPSSDMFTTVYSTFPLGTTCDVCGLLFLGAYYQGYKVKDEINSWIKNVHRNCLSNVTNNSSMKMGGSLKQTLRITPGQFVSAVKYSGTPAPPDNKTPLIYSVNDKINMIKTEKNWCFGISQEGSLKGFFPCADYQTWYVGKMTRDQGCELLNQRTGNFLIRMNPDSHHYALSLKVNNDNIKHLKIQTSHINNNVYLDKNMEFPSLASLVDYYRTHYLSEILPQLNNLLLIDN